MKTSWFGGDPNWGRILDALGYSAAQVDESRVDVGYSAPGSKKIVYALKGGKPTDVAFKTLCAAVAPHSSSEPVTAEEPRDCAGMTGSVTESST